MEEHVIATHLILFVLKFCGKEFSFSNPWHKDMITCPEVQVKNLFIGNPFQSASW